MKYSTISACVACTALLVSVVANAADDDKAALFDRLDANHDGQLTADEVPPEHRVLFDRLLQRADRNGDGKLSREEFMSGLADDQPNRIADRPGDARASAVSNRDSDEKIRAYAASIVKQYDTNGDGVLDKNEWSKLNNAEKYDRNHDGKITLDEIIETLSPTKRTVEDPSGFGRRGPMAGGIGGGGFGGGAMAGGAVGPYVGIALFRALDTNSDGKLDAKEIAAAGDVLKKLANSNGEITREDLLKTLPPGAGPMGGGFGGGGGGGGLLGALGGPMSDEQLLKVLDKNGDGKLQKSELPPRFQERFDEFDTNHDGVLDESEFKNLLPRLARQLQQREGRKGGEPPARRPMPGEQNQPNAN